MSVLSDCRGCCFAWELLHDETDDEEEEEDDDDDDDDEEEEELLDPSLG